MTVKELIEQLQTANPDLPVVIETTNNDGCSTCGYGATKDEQDIEQVHDLETRVVLSF